MNPKLNEKVFFKLKKRKAKAFAGKNIGGILAILE